VYLSDSVSKTYQNMISDNEFSVSLKAGEYNNRFFLNFFNVSTDIPDVNPANNPLNIYSSNGILKAEIQLDPGATGTLTIYALTGQALFVTKIPDPGYYEFNPNIKNGVYIVTLISGNKRISKKIFIRD